MQAYVQASPLTVKPLGTAKNYKRSVNVSGHFYCKLDPFAGEKIVTVAGAFL